MKYNEMVDIQRLRAMSLKATRDRGMFINALLGAFMNMGVYRNSIFAIHSLFLSFGVRIFFRQLIFGDLSRICDSQGVKIRI